MQYDEVWYLLEAYGQLLMNNLAAVSEDGPCAIVMIEVIMAAGKMAFENARDNAMASSDMELAFAKAGVFQSAEA